MNFGDRLDGTLPAEQNGRHVAPTVLVVTDSVWGIARRSDEQIGQCVQGERLRVVPIFFVTVLGASEGELAVSLRRCARRGQIGTHRNVVLIVMTQTNLGCD